jgi:hypothetical protein
MLQLKTRMIEADNPVGVKKTSNWKLPPIDFVYGKENIPDKEDASLGMIHNFNLILNSYKKLEYSLTF